jgi:hypothetical protein
MSATIFSDFRMSRAYGIEPLPFMHLNINLLSPRRISLRGI